MATHSSILPWEIPWTQEPGQATVHGVAKSQTQLSNWTTTNICIYTHTHTRSSQVALVVKNPSTNSGDGRDVGSIPESRRSPGGGNGSPLQYSCLESPMDRGAWRAAVHGWQSQTWLKWYSMHAHIHTHTPTITTKLFPSISFSNWNWNPVT